MQPLKSFELFEFNLRVQEAKNNTDFFLCLDPVLRRCKANSLWMIFMSVLGVSFTSLKFFLGLTHFAHDEDTKKYPEWSFSFLSPKSIS